MIVSQAHADEVGIDNLPGADIGEGSNLSSVKYAKSCNYQGDRTTRHDLPFTVIRNHDCTTV